MIRIIIKIHQPKPTVNWKFEYAGNFIFRDGEPDRILTGCGHIDVSGLAPVYHWWLTDHLGNVRVVSDSLGTISQTNHYAPYGDEIGVNTFAFTMGSLTPYQATENLFRYGAKEWNETFSDYDFLARYFSTNYARFSSQDPLSEKYYHLSPYAYCAGNPIKYIDNDGQKTRIYISKNLPGHAFLTTGEGSNTILYTYGRYGALNTSSGLTSGGATPRGEGVFGRFSKEATYKYLESLMLEDKFDIFEINNIDEKKVELYYNSIFYSSNLQPSDPLKTSYNNPDYKVIDTYCLMSNNCVTTTRRGVSFAGGNLWSNTVIPYIFGVELSIQSYLSEDVTKIKDPELFVEELLRSFYKHD